MRRILATAAGTGLAFASLGVFGTSQAQAQAQADRPPPLASINVVIQELKFSGLNDADDSYMELFNTDPINTVDISGWRFVRCNADGSTTSTVFTVAAGTTLAEFDVTAPRDSIYLVAAGGHVDTGGVTVADATETALGLDNEVGVLLHSPDVIPVERVDEVSTGVTTSGRLEDLPASPPQVGNCISRTPLGTDTDNNYLDFMEQSCTAGSA